MVKQFIARESGRDAPRDPVRGIPLLQDCTLRSLGRLLPGEAEITRNPRARSAVVRSAARL
jgi:16S rRNA C1402 N4-methylase RsmH